MITNAENREILGIHILAPNSADLIATAMMIIKNNMTVDDVLETLPVFPTLSEAIKIAALSVDRDIKTLSCCV